MISRIAEQQQKGRLPRKISFLLYLIARDLKCLTLSDAKSNQIEKEVRDVCLQLDTDILKLMTRTESVA